MFRFLLVLINSKQRTQNQKKKKINRKNGTQAKNKSKILNDKKGKGHKCWATNVELTHGQFEPVGANVN